MSKESMNRLFAFSRDCDTNKFMSMLPTPKKGVASIDVMEWRKWIRQSHETGRAVVAFAAGGYLMMPKSANYPPGTILGLCSVWYIEAYAQHPEYQEFVNVVVDCVPNLKELMKDVADLFSQVNGANNSLSQN